MANSFPAPPANFVGREDYVTRLKARLEHFRFFLYEGISGVGKTSLLLRLAQEAKAVGIEGALYLQVNPGEGVSSILARLECRLQGHGRVNLDQQGDPYVRLVELLDSRKLALILDSLQNLRRDDLPALTRMFYKAKTGNYRVFGAIRGDPGLSAMDRGQLHMERLGALSPAEVRALATQFKFEGEALAALEADATRGGAVGQPLLLRCLLSLCGPANLPPKEFLDTQSARSVHAFKAFLPYFEKHLPAPERKLVGSIVRLGMPISLDVARAVLGSDVDHALSHGLLDNVDGDLVVHHLVSQAFSGGQPLQDEPAQQVAKHLQERAAKLGEPLAAIRAAEVLAHAGFTETAVESLAHSWEWARDPGFLEAYLKTLATVPARDGLGSRLKLLSVQARMRQGNPMAVLPEMERLAEDPDPWTRARALASLAYIQSEIDGHAKVVAAYEALKKAETDPEMLLSTGILAAEALVRLDRLSDGEALIQALIKNPNNTAIQSGELRRMLGRIEAKTGRLADAVEQVRRAAEAFSEAGDVYRTATAYGLIGDLYREAGEFQEAKAAFAQFLEMANKWGDRNLIQLAELSDAWVSLDIGDVAHAAKVVANVQKDLGPAPSRRLKRTLAAAQALLEAGRGHHDKAAALLIRVVDTWEAAGGESMAGGLKAQLIRSLIACGKLDDAEATVVKALKGLDPEVHGARMGSLLRERALIHLRRGEPGKAMEELAQARALFAKGGNRREEALTLHRIAHAALDEGNIDLAAEKAAEALDLATKIKHARAKALARELQSRLALLRDEPDQALENAREALTNLRRLGDELGVLHVSETLLRAYLYAGDLAMALRLGPKLRDLAARLEVPEVRVRAVALTGVGLLRRERLDAAARCFRELPSKGLSPWTRALMGRFGEGLALAQGNQPEALKRRAHWLSALKQLPHGRRVIAIHALQQLALAPRDRCELRTSEGRRLLGTEELGLLDPREYELFIDVLYRRIYDQGKAVKLASPELSKLLMRMVLSYPEALPYKAVLQTLGRKEDSGSDTKLKALCKDVQKGLKDSPHVVVEAHDHGLRLTPNNTFAFLLPVWLTNPLTDTQKDILKLLRRLGSAPMQTIQTQCKLSRSAARKDMGQLTKTKLVEAVREGRGQVYRLA